jgi:hypothetical protein
MECDYWLGLLYNAAYSILRDATSPSMEVYIKYPKNITMMVGPDLCNATCDATCNAMKFVSLDVFEKVAAKFFEHIAANVCGYPRGWRFSGECL